MKLKILPIIAGALALTTVTAGTIVYMTNSNVVVMREKNKQEMIKELISLVDSKESEIHSKLKLVSTKFFEDFKNKHNKDKAVFSIVEEKDFLVDSSYKLERKKDEKDSYTLKIPSVDSSKESLMKGYKACLKKLKDETLKTFYEENRNKKK